MEKWATSSQVETLLAKQLKDWPLAKNNYEKLNSICTHSFDLGGFIIKTQFTPSRLLSSGAKIDIQSLQKRKCFLCEKNLPEEQEWLFFDPHYYILCNPYPIFPEHFTIPTIQHLPQEILPRFNDFLELVKNLDKYTIFYNGPKSGASAPDHAHFQAVTQGIMPIDNEIDTQIKLGEVIIRLSDGILHSLIHYLRNGFVIQTKSLTTARKLFEKVYNSLDILPDETEPKMNLFGLYRNYEWTIIIIPRKQHRPTQFYAEEEAQLLVSPGAADIGGLFITARKEDFDKINSELLRDIYQQVCYSTEDINRISEIIRLNSNEMV